jgi:hypothetical protein
MLVPLTPRQRLEILASQFEPLLRAAFMEAIEDIRSQGVLRRILERLERGDIAGALDGLNLESQNPIDQVDKPKPIALKCPDTNGGAAEVDHVPEVGAVDDQDHVTQVRRHRNAGVGPRQRWHRVCRRHKRRPEEARINWRKLVQLRHQLLGGLLDQHRRCPRCDLHTGGP